MTPPKAPSWMTPQFGFQLLTYILTAVLTAAGMYWAVVGDVRDLAKEQARTTAALEEVQRSLPNSGVLELRLQAIEKEQEEQAEAVKGFDNWVRLTREDLIRAGVIKN